MDRTKLVESAFADAFKLRGFRKQGRNWFRTTSVGEYQVISLQKSRWGSGDFHLNLGWGLVARDLPGTILLGAEMGSRIPEDAFLEQLTDVVINPVAAFMESTPSVIDLVPLLSAKPQFAFVRMRQELSRRGYELPSARV